MIRKTKTNLNTYSNLFNILRQNEKTTALIMYADVISLSSLESGLKRTKSGVSPGLDSIIKANITTRDIEKIHKALKQQRYKPNPSKRILIPMPGGGNRPLSIASQTDKIVQAALLNHLEQRLDGTFSKHSYGFRPGLGCHDALKTIKTKWQSIKWIINIDVKKCFDRMQHNILLTLLGQYLDQPCIELIRKFLRAGYVDIHNLNDRSEYETIGIPQGSLISPILCNLYLNELDKFVSQELLKWNFGESRRYLPLSDSIKTITESDRNFMLEYPELKKQIQTVKHNRAVLASEPRRDPKDPNFRRLHYNRYADDFLLGFIGTKKEAEGISDNITNFLLDKLFLEKNETKSGIYHSGDKNIKYLGVYLRYIPTNKIVKVVQSSEPVSRLKQVAINSCQLRAPIKSLMEKAVFRGHAKTRKNETYRATSCRRLCSGELHEIVNNYSAIIRGILNYYSFVNSKSDLWPIVSLYRKACALTIADKLKLKTASKVFNKFGPKLRVAKNKGLEFVVLDYPTTLKTSNTFMIGKRSVNPQSQLEDTHARMGSYKTRPKEEKCQYMGCEETSNLEAHHLKAMASVRSRKDLTSFEKALIDKKRATITLCKYHHDRLHSRALLNKNT